jgi:hypothetical protein
MINVYLDDLRPAPQGFVRVKTVEECIEILETREVGILSLDHDLGVGEPTGYDLAKYIVRHNLFPKQAIIIHSANPFGRLNMYRLLKRHKPRHVELYINPAFPWI